MFDCRNLRLSSHGARKKKHATKKSTLPQPSKSSKPHLLLLNFVNDGFAFMVRNEIKTALQNFSISLFKIFHFSKSFSFNNFFLSACRYRHFNKRNGSVELIDVRKNLPLKTREGLTEWSVPAPFLHGPIHQKFEHVAERDQFGVSKNGLVKPEMFPIKDETTKKLDLKKCVRCFPQDNDAGGFFLAVFKKTKHNYADTLEPDRKRGEVQNSKREEVVESESVAKITYGSLPSSLNNFVKLNQVEVSVENENLQSTTSTINVDEKDEKEEEEQVEELQKTQDISTELAKKTDERTDQEILNQIVAGEAERAPRLRTDFLSFTYCNVDDERILGSGDTFQSVRDFYGLEEGVEESLILQVMMDGRGQRTFF